MSSQSLVSIIVNNYNYAEFVGVAIDSALRQSHPNIEVIVVDDGSTDASRDVIESYGNLITPIFKENGGQASALNTGFFASNGEFVFFLDADDELHPHIVDLVVQAFDDYPDMVKVQFRMQEVDSKGTVTGAEVPRQHRKFRSGDLRHYFVRHHTYTWPWTSGNGYRASALRMLLPIPEDVYRISADAYLASMSVLAGPIVSLDEIGCSYRIHNRNNFTSAELNLDSIRQLIQRFYRGHCYLKKFADEQGLEEFPATADDLCSLDLLVPQIMSYRLDRANHPVPTDTAMSLLRRALSATVGNPEYKIRHQVAHAAWIISFMCSPRPVARWLCEIRRAAARGS